MAIPFGRYQLLRKIAAGGMGQVLLARKGAEGFEKLVVIKRILPHLVEDEEFFTMFLDEARITMRLDHPNIARINEFGVENGIHYLEMEYVAGEDVRRMDKRAKAVGTAIPLGVTLRIFADAAAGLDFAHTARDAKGQPLNLVHRDVSPQNILLGFDGSVKMIDFGVAKAAGRGQHTATGILKGKFPYMSPEQAEGYEVDARSDVFALGIVLWEQLTGRRLFKGENDLMTQRLVKACEVPPPSTIEPSLPADLDEVVLKALKKNVDERYKSCGELRMALEDYALKHSIPASAAHFANFMRELYAERIEREADPRFLEEDTGLTELDGGGVSKSHTEAAKTEVDGGRNRPQTEAVAKPAAGISKGWVFAGAVALLIIVAAGWFATHTGLGAETQVKVEPPPVPPPQVKPATVAFTLQSEPPGAEVELDGVKKGLTPLDVTLEKAKLPLVATLTHEGFEPKQATLEDGMDPVVSLKLTKKAPAAVVKPPTVKIKTTR